LDNAYYWWDNVRFVEGQYIKYPHPDRDYYGVSPFSSWSIAGNQLLHCQFDQSTSRGLAVGGPAVIGAAIGAAIGLFGGPVGAALGAILGAVIASVIAWVGGWIILDDWDCMWWWISGAFIQWFLDNLDYLTWLMLIFGPTTVAWEMSQALLSCGYVRVGSYTFLDAIGMGNPSPPPPPPPSYYVSSIVAYTPYGYGVVNNPYGLIGSSNDGSYAQIYGGNLNDGGNIVGFMNAPAHGNIELYGYSAPGYYTHLYVYVSYNNNNDWVLTRVQTVYPGSAAWINCGSYGSNFRYIAIAAIDDNGMSANILIDSVKVTP
jgi:hypothetical protein